MNLEKYLMFLTSSIEFILLIISPKLVFAKSDAVLCKDAQENYYQYDFKPLNKDVVRNALEVSLTLIE